MEIVLTAHNTLTWPGGSAKAAIGRSGKLPAALKREGDGKTPRGIYLLRRVHYRPDKGPAPRTALPVRPIAEDDGWCDAPSDANYNRPVKLPYPASAERMWRSDDLYDVVIEIGHNDDPVVPGLGSAVFLHVAKPDYQPTEGCVALAGPDLRALLKACGPGDTLRID